MAVPPAIGTSDEPSKTNDTITPNTPSTSPNSHSTSQAPNPEFVLTPATPSTPHTSTNNNKVAEPLPIPGEIKEDKMMEKEQTTDSQTGLVGGEKKAGTGSGPIETLTRKLSSRSKTSNNGDKKSNNTTAPVTTEKTPAATSSSSAPANATRSNAAKKPAHKKKKRSGFSGFLLRMGCLSADEFEDPEPKKGASSTTNAKTQTPGSSASTSAAAKTTAPVETKTETPKEVKPAVAPAVTSSPRTETTAPTAAVLTTGTDKDQSEAAGHQPTPEDESMVASQEPTIPSEEETAGMTSSAVQAPGSGSALLSTPVRPSSSRRQSGSSPGSAPEGERTETSGGYSNISESEIPDESSGAAGGVPYHEEYEDEYEDDEDRLIAQGGIGIPIDENGNPAPLLRPMDPDHVGRKCLVLDLDETLLHSSFKMLPSADYIVPVEIESQTHNVYVIKRPGVDNFLTEMGKIYEVVVFTASLSKYADPVMDMLDPARVIRHRLFRESCYNHKGNYVKDLSQLGRDMESSIIIDNSPASYIFHPNNAVPVSTWFNDPHDTELTDLCPFLTDLATVEDIRGVLDGSI